MATLLVIHSVIRWVIVVVGVLALVKLAIGWAQKSKFGGMDRGLTAAYTGLMDLQTTLGLVILFWSGLVDGVGFPRHRLEHAFALILATVVAHLAAYWRKSSDTIRFRNTFLTLLVSMVLVYLGVLVIGGWTW